MMNRPSQSPILVKLIVIPSLMMLPAALLAVVMNGSGHHVPTQKPMIASEPASGKTVAVADQPNETRTSTPKSTKKASDLRVAAATPPRNTRPVAIQDLVAKDLIAHFDARIKGQDLKTQPDFSVQIKSGQSLASTLGQQKISPAKIEQIARSLAPHFNLRKLRPGDIVHGFMRTNDDTGDDTGTSLYKLELVPARSASGQAKRSYLAVLQSPGRFDVVTVLKPLLSSTRLVEQSIDLSLLYTMELAGIHQGVAAAFADIFAFDIDFQRDIHPGDRFSILFEERRDPDTGKIIGGTIKRAELEVRKQARIYYPFKLESSRIAYFDSKGNSARRALLKTPIAAGRLSSGYGMRKHPILGYNRMHRGVDFAAPRGTPIFAAGDGTVEMVGRSGGYGKLIRIRHNGSYKTVYAHMSRFAKGMRRGKRVQQGQVIGYVGSTGMSTGPHLHYEIVLNGKQINPSTLKLAHSRKIPAARMDAFEQSRLDIERQFALLQESNPGGPDGESVQLATGSVPASDDPGQ